MWVWIRLFKFVSVLRVAESIGAKSSLVSLRRSTYLFSVALVMVIYFVRFVYVNAGQPGDIHEVTYHYEGVLLNGTRYEMVRVNRSMRRLIEGSSVEAPTQNVREELANTLLSDVGFKYVVRPVRQIKKSEKDPLLSNDHIYYAKKVYIYTYIWRETQGHRDISHNGLHIHQRTRSRLGTRSVVRTLNLGAQCTHTHACTHTCTYIHASAHARTHERARTHTHTHLYLPA